MKILLCTTLAVFLVAAVTAQSDQQHEDASAIQGLIEKLNEVVSSLGGFEGTVNKLEYITSLVQKAYNDKGIGGWMARNLIKLELSSLKQKALDHEKVMINNLLDHLESKVGLSSYSEDVAENYILSEAVKKAIEFIRHNIQEIVHQIGEAQKEHDAAAGRISKEALDKITDRLSGLKEKLRGLSKKLLDKLTGRDSTVEVYGADGGIRYEDAELYGADGGIRYMVSADSYILNELIKTAVQTLRERIFKYIELIAEATREAKKSFGETKQQALKHIEELKRQLRRSMAELKDTLLGRKTEKELEEEIKEDLDKSYSEIDYPLVARFHDGAELGDDTLYKIELFDANRGVLDGAIKELIGKIRAKILENIKQLGEAKRVAEEAAGDAREAAKERLAKLKEQLHKASKDLKDAIMGRQNKEEIEKDLEEETSYVAVPWSAELNLPRRDLLAKLRERTRKLAEDIKQAAQDLLSKTGAAKDAAKERLRKLREKLAKTTKDFFDAIRGKKSDAELEKDLAEETSYVAVPW